MTSNPRWTRRRVLPGCVLALALAMPIAPALIAADRPSLVVVIVVDQLPWGRLQALHPMLQGGLRRLLDEGRVFGPCAHAHAMTETGPGHATLLSGLLPRNNGIIMNEWYDREAHREVYCVGDPSPEGRPSFNASSDQEPVSPDNLVGENLADLIKRSRRDSKVFTVSGKDRSAVLTGGHHPDGAFWYDRGTGGFTSNPSIIGELPAWGGEFFMQDPWETSLYKRNIPDEWTYPERAEAMGDDYPFESAAFSRTSPHPVASAADGATRTRARQVLFSPWGDWLTIQLAARILDQQDLGRDDAPDLLVVALSSVDAVGHLWGPDSQEYLDILLRVDGWLEPFLRSAEKAAAGSGGAILALSADHGVLPLPETLPAARRIDPKSIEDRLEPLLKEKLAPDAAAPFVASVQGGQIYLDRRTLASHGIALDVAVEEARRILSGFWQVARVYRAADLATDGAEDPFLALHRASWHPERGGDLVIQPCRECLLTPQADGTSHGSPYEYDRDVPLVLMGPGVERGRVDAACRTVDLAPTLADLLGLRFESPRDGKPLSLGSGR